MGVYSKYLYQLVQSVAYSLDDCRVVTAEAGSTNTNFICSYLTEADDYFKGWDLRIFAGVNAGQTRKVSDFHNTNTTVIVAPAFTSALATNSQGEFHRLYSYEQYKDAINRAIEMARDDYLIDKIDETVALATDTYEYAIPAGFRYICGIWLEDPTDANTYYDSGWIHMNHYTVMPHNTTANKLKFHDNSYAIGASVNGKKLRIIGLATQEVLSNDSDTCELPPEYVIQQARALLLYTRDDKQTVADRAQGRANEERRQMVTTVPALAKTVFET